MSNPCLFTGWDVFIYTGGHIDNRSDLFNVASTNKRWLDDSFEEVFARLSHCPMLLITCGLIRNKIALYCMQCNSQIWQLNACCIFIVKQNHPSGEDAAMGRGTKQNKQPWALYTAVMNGKTLQLCPRFLHANEPSPHQSIPAWIMRREPSGSPVLQPWERERANERNFA